MDSGKARELYLQYSTAMAYVAVEDPDGAHHIGSAFHLGDGVFVTARHVVEGSTIVEIASTERTYVPLSGAEAETARTFLTVGGERRPVHRVDNGELQLAEGPYLHPDPLSDVAVFKVAGLDPRTPFVPLGSHLDDWLGSDDFIMSEAIVLGYPPVPMTVHPVLVGARAEVNALVDVRQTPHVHFVLSAMPRGGFSGGLVLSEYGYALGLVTRSLLRDTVAEELGFMVAVAVEPIFVCAADAKLLPACQADGWDDFWNTEESFFIEPGADPAKGGRVVGTVAVFDDGERCYLELSCDWDRLVLEEAVHHAEQALGDCSVRRSPLKEGTIRLEVAVPCDPDRLKTAKAAAERALSNAGFHKCGGFGGSEV